MSKPKPKTNIVKKLKLEANPFDMPGPQLEKTIGAIVGDLYKNIPWSEAFNLMRMSFSSHAPKEKMLPEAEYKHWVDLFDKDRVVDALKTVAYIRLTNKACAFCADKNIKLTCRKCKLTSWCSNRCAQNHETVHSMWCCQKYGPRDTGPMGSTFLELSDRDKPKDKQADSDKPTDKQTDSDKPTDKQKDSDKPTDKQKDKK